MSAGMAQQLEELNFAESNIPEEHIELIELFISQKSNQMIADLAIYLAKTMQNTI